MNKKRDVLDPVQRDLCLGMVRLYALYRAAKDRITGRQLSQELRRRGFPLNARSLGAILRGMERKGYIASSPANRKGPPRKTYLATVAGRQAIEQAGRRLRASLGLCD